MTLENYILYLQGTIETYPSKVKKHLLKLFVEEGIAQAEQQIKIDTDSSIDVIDMELEDQLKICVRESKKAVKLFEKWEFLKDYKYSTLFISDCFDEVLIKASAVLNLIDTDDYENTTISESLNKPIRYEDDNVTILKFGLSYSAVHNLTGKEMLIKYPVLIVLYKRERIIEFRFDALKRFFLSEKKEQTVYLDLIKDLKCFFDNQLQCGIIPLSLEFLISETKDQENVRFMAQYVKLPSGGNAQLDVGKNEEYVLPIIGDLKEILRKHVVELEKTPVLKEALDQFIFENDELSDYTWIEVMWENEIKTRNIRVKFIFNYRNNEYCLLQHYYNNVLIGMERMNSVVKFISDHRPLG